MTCDSTNSIKTIKSRDGSAQTRVVRKIIDKVHPIPFQVTGFL